MFSEYELQANIVPKARYTKKTGHNLYLYYIKLGSKSVTDMCFVVFQLLFMSDSLRPHGPQHSMDHYTPGVPVVHYL